MTISDSLEIRAALREIWAEVLGTADVPMDADFFELGGTSTGAVEVVLALEKRFGVRVELEQFLDAPTIQDLARAVMNATPAAW
jgi:acyl carrier protein